MAQPFVRRSRIRFLVGSQIRAYFFKRPEDVRDLSRHTFTKAVVTITITITITITLRSYTPELHLPRVATSDTVHKADAEP